ncbi:MAG: hypothetical protein AAGI01_05845, partial [Myxococcota bacterium]
HYMDTYAGRRISRVCIASMLAGCSFNQAASEDGSQQVYSARVMSAPAASVAPSEVTLGLELEAPVVRVSERYVSVAVDAAQVVGGVFWDPSGKREGGLGTARYEPLDFDHPRLRALAGALAPSMLRVGGSEADRIYYDLGGESSVRPPRGFHEVLTKQRWDEVGRFARELDFEVIFTLNAGPGVRDESGRWMDEQARALVAYTTERAYPVRVWELGNELNAFWVVHGITESVAPAVYGEDLQRARRVLDEVAPGAKLAGPSSAFWPKWGEGVRVMGRALEAAGGAVDVVTWHYYPQQSSRCPVRSRPARPWTLLDGDNLDEVSRWAGVVERARDAHAPGAEVWLGETGHAQCGGQVGLSDTFASSLWWVDQLGLIARRGQPVAVRQTLVGSDYGLLDPETFAPRPDYWATLLWRRLMGARVLEATLEGGAEHVRTYAHCMRGAPGHVSVVLINRSAWRRASVELPSRPGSRAVHVLSAAGLRSRTVRHNGRVLELGPDDALPAIEPEEHGEDTLELAPNSIAFVLWDASAPACHGEVASR